MTNFRPCLDLHEGQVKQIVGGSFSNESGQTIENHVSENSARWFAARYRDDNIPGGHVIMLGSGNDDAARMALAEYPGGLHVGGGISESNAVVWLEAGASHVIVTTCLFDEHGCFQSERLDRLVAQVGRKRIVIDLSCKQTTDGWGVTMNRWQTMTDLRVEHKTLDMLSERCDEFLIHAADREGLCSGIDRSLVELMGQWGKIPMTYAGGISNMSDVESVASLGNGRVDFTVGSSLDLFGGSGIRYAELLKWNRRSVHAAK